MVGGYTKAGKQKLFITVIDGNKSPLENGRSQRNKCIYLHA